MKTKKMTKKPYGAGDDLQRLMKATKGKPTKAQIKSAEAGEQAEGVRKAYGRQGFPGVGKRK